MAATYTTPNELTGTADWSGGWLHGGPFRIRFDNNGSTDGKNCRIWFRDVMLVEGTEPHAWAPAEGEVWP